MYRNFLFLIFEVVYLEFGVAHLELHILLGTVAFILNISLAFLFLTPLVLCKVIILCTLKI